MEKLQAGKEIQLPAKRLKLSERIYRIQQCSGQKTPTVKTFFYILTAQLHTNKHTKQKRRFKAIVA